MSPVRPLAYHCATSVVLILAVTNQRLSFAGQSPTAAAEDEGLPLPPVPQSYRDIIERQQREAEQRRRKEEQRQREAEERRQEEANSPDRDPWEQFNQAAKDYDQAAIDDLKDAVNAAKEAGAKDPANAVARSAKARVAHDKVVEAMNKFEAAARNAQSAAVFALELRRSGITPGPAYNPEGYKKAIRDMQPATYQPRPNPYGGPELESSEEMAEAANRLEKAAVGELEEAATAAKEAGALDPKDVDGRAAKARIARDHALNAIRNFEAAQRYARSGAQMRQGPPPEKMPREKIPGYGQGPMMPPPGFGMGEERKDRFDPWPMKK
ncbi:MAG TPA: hypothetical protein VGL11_20960 [Candidatus Binatia bacterium]